MICFLVSGSSGSLVTGDLVQLQLYAPPLPGLVWHSRYQGEQKYALIYVNLTLSVTIVLIWGAFFSMKYWFLNPELLSSVYFKTPFWMSSVLCAWNPTVVATAFLKHISHKTQKLAYSQNYGFQFISDFDQISQFQTNFSEKSSRSWRALENLA